MNTPTGWRQATLGKECTIEIGGTPSRGVDAYWDTDHSTKNAWVSIRDMHSRVITDTAERVSVLGVRHSNVKLQPKGTVLLSFKLTIGRVAFTGIPLYTNEAIAGLQSKTLDSEYLYHGLQQWDLLHGVDQAIKGATLNKAKLKKISFVCPKSRDEQSKIAEVLSTADLAIAQTEALIAKQQRIKTGLMQDLLTRGVDKHGQLRFEATHAFKDSPLGRIPVEWDVNLLDVLATRGSGHTPSKQRPEYWNGGIKWISLADSSALDQVHINETAYEISDLGIRNSSAVLHPPGTVVLSRDAGVGKSAVMQTRMAVSQHFMAWRCGRRLHNYFLYYWLQYEKPRFEGIASGSTIVTIGLQFFKRYRIAHPRDPEEQISIANALLKSEETARRFEETLVKLHRLKTALMQDLLTGKVRVTPLLQHAQAATA